MVTSAQGPPLDMRPVEKVPSKIMVKLSKKASPQRPPQINGQTATWPCVNLDCLLSACKTIFLIAFSNMPYNTAQKNEVFH